MISSNCCFLFLLLIAKKGWCLECGRDQFKCENTNVNAILSINEWNKESSNCIPVEYRCDGRHDCQDGSDEFECKFTEVQISRTFMCYVGKGQTMDPIDCTSLNWKSTDTDAKKTLISESLEWSCTKRVANNGTIMRNCEKTYTGGENFSICFWNSEEGTKCICSRQLCNMSVRALPHILLYIVLLCSTIK